MNVLLIYLFLEMEKEQYRTGPYHIDYVLLQILWII